MQKIGTERLQKYTWLGRKGDSWETLQTAGICLYKTLVFLQKGNCLKEIRKYIYNSLCIWNSNRLPILSQKAVFNHH